MKFDLGELKSFANLLLGVMGACQQGGQPSEGHRQLGGWEKKKKRGVQIPKVSFDRQIT